MADNQVKEKRPRALNAQMELFCSFYVAVGSKTFSKGKQSAVAAKYTQAAAAAQATRLLKMPKIKQRIRELHAENMDENLVTIHSVLNNLAHDREGARKKGDWSTAVRSDELFGKFLTMFVDKTIINLEDMRQLDDDQRESARVIASALLSTGLLDNMGGMGRCGKGENIEDNGGKVPVQPGAIPTTDVGRAVAEREVKPAEQPVKPSAMLTKKQSAPKPKPKPKPKRSRWVQTQAELEAELDADRKRQDNPDDNSITGIMRRNSQRRHRNSSDEQNTCINE